MLCTWSPAITPRRRYPATPSWCKFIRTQQCIAHRGRMNSALQHDRLVRQFVRPRGAAGEMLREELADRRDSVDRAVLESPFAEGRLHRPANGLPRILRDFAVDAAVGNDLYVLIGEQHVDQHTAVVLGIPDAEPSEQLERPPPRPDPA